jgi:hypothetical protein
LYTHKVVHEVAFSGPKEVTRMDIVDHIAMLCSVVAGRLEWRWYWWECRHVG